MKKTTLLCTALLMISINGLLAQCKFKLDKTDAISGAKEQRIYMKFGMFEQFAFAFYHNGEDHRLESYLTLGGEQNFILPKGSILDIKLGNGKKFRLCYLKA